MANLLSRVFDVEAEKLGVEPQQFRLGVAKWTLEYTARDAFRDTLHLLLYAVQLIAKLYGDSAQTVIFNTGEGRGARSSQLVRDGLRIELGLGLGLDPQAERNGWKEISADIRLSRIIAISKNTAKIRPKHSRSIAHDTMTKRRTVTVNQQQSWTKPTNVLQSV